MTKKFTVNVGGQNMDVWGPDEGTQEQAQEQATRLMAQKQTADVQRDFSGPGRVLANVAQGGAELVGGPAQLMGATPGPLYQQAEATPTTTGDKIARFTGAALPFTPLGAIAGGTKVIPGGATTVAGAPASKVGISTIPPWLAGATVPRAVGAIEGASAPADSNTQRAINTGIGAFTGGLGRGAASSTLDRLAGMVAGGWAGHGIGGWVPALIGGKVGSEVGPETHQAVAGFLRQFPPSVVARAIAQLGDPFTRMLAKQYDAMPSDRPQTPPQQ